MTDRVERAGGYLERSDAGTTLRGVEEFGRSKPWAVALGGLALGGLALECRNGRETVEAIGYKTDVRTWAMENISGTPRDGQVQRRRGRLKRERSHAWHRGRQTFGGGRRAWRARTPIGLALGSFAVGFLADMLVPSARVEDETLGEVSDRVKEKVKETAHEAPDRGKQVAEEAAQSAKEAGSPVEDRRRAARPAPYRRACVDRVSLW